MASTSADGGDGDADQSSPVILVEDERPEPLAPLKALSEEFGIPLERLETLVWSVTTSTSHAGPLPRPEDAERYEVIRAGSFDDIVKMAQKEQSIKENAILKRLGNDHYAITVSLTGVVGLIAVAGVCAWLGQPLLSGIMGIASALLLMVRFTVGQITKKD